MPDPGWYFERLLAADPGGRPAGDAGTIFGSSFAEAGSPPQAGARGTYEPQTPNQRICPTSVGETLVSFVPRLDRLICKMLIRRGVADSGIRNRNAQVI